MSRLRTLIYFLRLGRPLFLVGGVLLYGLGVVIALYQGATLTWSTLLVGQIAVSAIQIMTHYSNDYFDLAADLANPTPIYWSGGSRILPEGRLSPRLALASAIVAALIALLATLALAFLLPSGPLTLPLLLLALLLAWSYSAPPLRLHSTGAGELAAAVLITGMTPLMGFYLQAGRLALLPVLAVLPLCAFQVIMLLLIEFPDARGDAAVGKATLVVRLGPAGAARLVLALLALIYLALLFLPALGLPVRVALSILAFSGPAALWLALRLSRGAWAQPRWWSWLGFVGVALIVGTAFVELVAFLSLLPGRWSGA